MLGADAGLDGEPEFGGFKTQVILAHAGQHGPTKLRVAKRQHLILGALTGDPCYSYVCGQSRQSQSDCGDGCVPAG